MTANQLIELLQRSVKDKDREMGFFINIEHGCKEKELDYHIDVYAAQIKGAAE